LEITSEIFQVGGTGFTSQEDAAVYLIHSDNHSALIDAGCGHAHHALIRNIQSCHVDPESIEYLFLTHCHFDHTGGVKAIKESNACKVVAHELDALFLEQGDDEVTAATWYGSTLQPFKVDIKLKGSRQEFQLGDKKIEAYHTPGHSPGSVVYVMESDNLRVLFGQDVHGPLHPSLLSDKTAYQVSLDFLLSMKADILCEGHFGVFKGKREVERFIRSFIQ
jgi:glyoxylase-like metal-dependent hydrolase (beta-lactamase superfamily II)